MQTLSKLLHKLDGKGYKAYKDIAGRYQFDHYQLNIDHVQGDPFAAPSRISIRVAMSQANIPSTLWKKNDIRRTACEDYLARVVSGAIKQTIKGHRGSGCSGLIAIETSGQQILKRNAIVFDTVVDDDYIEARIVLGLPANGRRAAGLQAHDMLFKELPAIVEKSLYFKNLDHDNFKAHVDNTEDQNVLRALLTEQDLVSFIANDSLLPRLSGIDDKPLIKDALSFQAPESLRVSFTLPNSGDIQGMGISKGITLIVGGGFHGKSTLLQAIERGPFNHIPGDGREKVVTESSAVKVRAEDGRSIAKVNISPFIDRLPFNRDTQSFSTDNASGSTSQAANIIEAIECGTELLLIDEDTSATNFMIRDERMQALVVQDKEPITPLVSRVRELYEENGISSIIVMGGSGDYFDVADTVIMMDCYEPKDVTIEAKKLARDGTTTNDNIKPLPKFNRLSSRKPGANTLDASRKNRDVKIDTRDLRTILYGEHRIDLALVEQLIDMGQTRAIGLAIYYYAKNYAKNYSKKCAMNSAQDSDSMIQGLKNTLRDIDSKGLDIISPYKVGNLALPRLHEIAAAINRIREGSWQD